jgi:ubiquinone/menaquinone biosynthesis C-methylase UbiE
MADKYERLYGLDLPRNRVKLDRKAKLMAEYTGMTFGKRILEVACGTGVFTSRFALTGVAIDAIDTSYKMLSKQSRYSLDYGGPVVLSLMDATSTTFQDAKFDAVVGGYALQWIPLDLLFREVYRVLKTGGRVAFVTDNGINPVAFMWRLINYIDSIRRDKIYPSLILPWVVKDKLEQAGFRNVVLKPVEFVYDRKVNFFLESVPILNKFGGSLFIGAEK